MTILLEYLDRGFRGVTEDTTGLGGEEKEGSGFTINPLDIILTGLVYIKGVLA